MQALVSHSLSQRDPISFVEDAPTAFPVLPASLTGMQSLTILRLSGRAYAAQPVSTPHTLLCIAWPVTHFFSVEEQALYAAVLDVAAAVVSNYRLRLEALEHVQQLRELDRLKSEFLATVNHELRTPLNAILALTSGILDGTTGEISRKLRADLEVVYRASEQLHVLILDILNFTQLESGKPIQLDVRPFPLDELTNEAVEFVRHISTGKSITIRSFIPASLPPVLADPQRVRQVLINLLVNATKFTDQGTIQVTAQVEGGKLVVCVEDSGTGILPEYQAVIFEPFRQLHSPGRPKGTGLGLSICKRLLALMDGNIWVESQIGKGSRFYFSLPTA
jgi:signal transduction histidine kinase